MLDLNVKAKIEYVIDLYSQENNDLSPKHNEAAEYFLDVVAECFDMHEEEVEDSELREGLRDRLIEAYDKLMINLFVES